MEAIKERIAQKQVKKVVAKDVQTKTSTKETEQPEQPAETEQQPPEKEPTGYHCGHCIKDYQGMDELEKQENGKLTCPECGYEVEPVKGD